MSEKRLRIFGGPNGSGKSTFINDFPNKKNLNLGVYINADDIEKTLRLQKHLDLNQFKIRFNTQEIQRYFQESTFAPIKLNSPLLWKSFTVQDDILQVDESLAINSYIAADLAEFLRQNLIAKGISFSFETVMSDFKKVEFLKIAKQKGYRIYLYYFSTEDPEINISRIQLRVAQNGHNVKSEDVKKRYYKSLENLKPAILLSDRAYLFDNTNINLLVAEITDGKNVNVIDPESVPNWFLKYVVE